MEQKHTELFKTIVSKGLRMRYGNKPATPIMVRYIWEMKNIIDYGFVDYYLMAYRIFREYTKEAKIGVWPFGAVSSSIVCYCMGLTEIDPMRYGLHSARFVNDVPPRFQFFIAQSRFDEFRQGTEKILMDNKEEFNIDTIRDCLLGKEVKLCNGIKRMGNIIPMNFPDKRCQRALPEDINDEITCYALSFPESSDLYATYIRRRKGETWSQTGFARLDEILASTYGILVFQEQMLDILNLFYYIRGIEANRIRKDIQREEAESPTLQAIKDRLITITPDALLTPLIANQFLGRRSFSKKDAELAWDALTSNRKTFLKAHAVSSVLSRYLMK